jgi:phosphatidylglycerophosphate synthase
VAQLATAGLLALGLVLDTADGHLARLQGTASEYGRWLDSQLDELADLVLHASVAWMAFGRDGWGGWLALGAAYLIGKYLFIHGNMNWDRSLGVGSAAEAGDTLGTGGVVRRLVRMADHADVRWHGWILLAAVGRLDVALAVYGVYFPARVVFSAVRRAKGVVHGGS